MKETKMCYHKENCPRDDGYCTEKCEACRQISLLNGYDIYVCLLEDFEVLPMELDLTPGYGQ